jgi:copper(I)-binding protein
VGDPDCPARPLTVEETQAWVVNVPEAQPLLAVEEQATFTPELSPEPSLASGITETLATSVTPEETSTLPEPPAATATLTAVGIFVDGTSGHVTLSPTIAAFYMLIHNTGTAADQLVGASSAYCASMGMQIMGIGPAGNDLPIAMAIPAGGVALLEFQGTRLLCYGVAGGVGPGSTVQVRLKFEVFGELEVTIGIGEKPDVPYVPGPGGYSLIVGKSESPKVSHIK